MGTIQKTAAQVEYSKKARDLTFANKPKVGIKTQILASTHDAAAREPRRARRLHRSVDHGDGDDDGDDDASAAVAVQPSIKLLSKTEMLARVGVSYSSVWNWIVAGTFPPGRALSDGKRGRIMWVEAEIEAWIASRPVRLPKSAKQRVA